MTKLTKKIALDIALTALRARMDEGETEYRIAGTEETFSAQDVMEKLSGMYDELVRKATAPKKPTKTQEANEGLKARVLEVLNGQSPKTVSEIMTMAEDFSSLSNQKMASIVRALVDENKLVRTTDKRKAYFALA